MELPAVCGNAQFFNYKNSVCIDFCLWCLTVLGKHQGGVVQDCRCARFSPGRFFFVSTHTHQLHLEVQERWEENKVGSLMVYLDKNIW